MAKIETLTTVSSGYLANSKITENFQKITTAFSNTLSRDGSSPNSMSADIDMNGHTLLNLPDPTNSTDVATKEYVDTMTATLDVAAIAQSVQDAEDAATNAEASADDSFTYMEASEGFKNEAESARDAAIAAVSAVNIPTSLTGQAANSIRVKGDETGYEFYTPTVSLTPYFAAFRTADQTIPTGTQTKLQVSTEDSDPANCYDNATNYRFTPNVAGLYMFTAAAYFITTGDGTEQVRCRVHIYKNGVSSRYSISTGQVQYEFGATTTVAMPMNGTTDYVECFVDQNSGEDRVVDFSSFSGFRIGA